MTEVEDMDEFNVPNRHLPLFNQCTNCYSANHNLAPLLRIHMIEQQIGLHTFILYTGAGTASLVVVVAALSLKDGNVLLVSPGPL